ncbi:hypothetical protein MTP99_002706 [Tenebrio molitor]|nr:hypothetical protein MTP99_002706 [Tenebrio molitor]
MLKLPKIKKESSKREREEGRTSEEGTSPFRKSSRMGRFPSRSKEGNKSKEMGKELKTLIREIREDTAEIRQENKVCTKKGISGSERGDERKRRKMAGGGGRLVEKDENDRGKDGTKTKEGEEE